MCEIYYWIQQSAKKRTAALRSGGDGKGYEKFLFAVLTDYAARCSLFCDSQSIFSGGSLFYLGIFLFPGGSSGSVQGVRKVSDKIGIEAQRKKLEAEGHTIIQKGRKNIRYFVKDYENVLFDCREIENEG